MKTMVYFRVSRGDYCIPVDVTRAVRSASGLIPLPAPRSHVAGIIPGDPPLTVSSILGTHGDHVIVIEAEDKTYGLLVEAVTGLRRINEADIRAAPTGQDRQLISGSIATNGHLFLVADPAAMAAEL